MVFAFRCAALLLAACVPVALTGCTSSSTTVETEFQEKGHDHGHDHDHDHAHEGPHGGHIIEIGEEEYHAEWTHDDSGNVTVYFLDAEMKKDVPVESETITIDTKVGDETKSYTLERDAEQHSKFSITDPALLGVLETLSEGVKATLNVEIAGKKYSAPIEHDHEHEHGHKH